MTNNPNRPPCLQKVIFARIAWMKHYQGATDRDVPVNGGEYIKQNEWGGECENFLPQKGNLKNEQYWGFFMLTGDNDINLTNLGEHPDATVSTGVTIVFIATKKNGGQYIVGWYKDATLYKEGQVLDVNDNCINFRATCSLENGKLLSPEERTFKLAPDYRPGQNNIWYGPGSTWESFFFSKLKFLMENHP